MQIQEKIAPLSVTMPLLGPQYQQEYYQQFLKLKLMMKRQEYTQEANKLCQIVIPFLQSNYNCWYIKKQCLKKGSTTYENEDNFSKKILMNKVKNFQIWDYRKQIIIQTKKYAEQYELIEKTLEIQYKNYHAWSYRAFLVTVAKNYIEQLKKLEKHIQKDKGNNSVWSYRYFLISQILAGKAEDADQEFMKTLIATQIKFVLQFLSEEANYTNQSLWNYLRGFFPSLKLKNFPSKKNTQKPNIIRQSYSNYPAIGQLCKSIIQQNSKNKGSIQAFITLLYIQSQNESELQYAKNICEILENMEHWRKNYWTWVKKNL